MKPPASSGPSAPSAASPRAPAADGLSGGNASESLTGYEVVVCVCGGIAAYKAAYLVSALVQAGAGVTVAMTRNARRFVGELSFRALSGRPVCASLWQSGASADIQHLKRTENADLIIVAPATANVIGKLAAGLADDIVSGLLLGAACPILLAPAMNARMWSNAAVQRNVSTLRESGAHVIGPGAGWQACRALGEGRMSEPAEILAAASSLLRSAPPRTQAAIRRR